MVFSLERFEGKVAIVTGASAGIGTAIVEDLVKSGVIVAGFARRLERLEALSKKLSKEKGKFYGFKCDMTKEQEIVESIKKVISTLGPISILVNNAGMNIDCNLKDAPTSAWKTIFDTNVIGLSIATREVMQNMISNKTQGHIVHMNSVGGHRVVNYPGFGAYIASKHAVTALTESLRHEINRDKLPIKITSISPGYVKTEFAEAMGWDDSELVAMSPEDIAGAVHYTLSTPLSVNVSEIMLIPHGSTVY